MPKKARIDAPGALHHIIIRGIERKVIFKDSQDYSNFLNRLRNVLTETKIPCFAWPLMTRRLKAKSKGKMAVDNIGHLCYLDFNFQPRTDSDGKILQGKI